MKIAVAGASGFIGSHLLKWLSGKEENKLAALVRKSSKRDNLAAIQDLDILEVDFQSVDSLRAALDDADVVINCIAMLGDYDHLSRKTHYEVDAGILSNLLEACNRKRLTQFIHISTTGVYGGKSSPDKLKEETPFGSKVSKYEWGKIEAEKVVNDARTSDGFPITIARPGPVFGPGMIYGWPILIKRIKEGSFRMIGAGETCFHITYIDDIAEGIGLLVGEEKAFGENFNVCGDEVPTINGYFSEIGKALEAPSFGRIPFTPVLIASHLLQFVPKMFKPGDLSLISPGRVRFFREHRVFDNSKLKTTVGFTPRVALRDGIDKALEWYRENGYL